MTSTAKNAALLFASNGYLLPENNVMGRHSAGNGFLRAAVAHHGGEKLWAFTHSRKSYDLFEQAVKDLDATANTAWCSPARAAPMSEIGTLYLPDPRLGEASARRLRHGADSYSLCGVTHTVSSHNAMDLITKMPSSDVMPWDALICTSTAARSAVEVMLNDEVERLKLRFGHDIPIALPQLPVIPLGIHCDDFAFSPDDRVKSRAALGIGEDEIVALFVGRLSFHAKAHPHAMMLALESAAQKTGKKIVLVQCGWFHHPKIREFFDLAAAQTCPNVRHLVVDSQLDENRKQSWAAADFFISLSDNFQETFGITPIEAMAAGLPVVVSDWDGYKDTVSEGEVGFRIPTWMPEDDSAHNFAMRFEVEIDTYDHYCGYTCTTVAIDQAMLVHRLVTLIENPELREKMGKKGKERAKEIYDWAKIFPRYQSLWAELGEIRVKESPTAAYKGPASSPSRPDPYKAFASYPTHVVSTETRIICLGSDCAARFKQISALDIYEYANQFFPQQATVEAFFRHLENSPGISVGELAKAMKLRSSHVIHCCALFAKMGLLLLSLPQAE